MYFYCTIQYCVVLCCVVLCCVVLCCVVLCCVVLYCIVLYCIVLYCIVLYCIVLYCIVLYCIVLYCSIPQYRRLCDVMVSTQVAVLLVVVTVCTEASVLRWQSKRGGAWTEDAGGLRRCRRSSCCQRVARSRSAKTMRCSETAVPEMFC